MSKLAVKKLSVLRMVGVVFLLVVLAVAVSLTNDKVRKFITDSFASNGCKDGTNCAACGSPRRRQQCWLEEEDNAKAAVKRQLEIEATLNKSERTKIEKSETPTKTSVTNTSAGSAGSSKLR